MPGLIIIPTLYNLNRQEKLDELVRRFKEKKEKLDNWAQEKEEFLQERPPLDTLIAAQAQVKLMDGYQQQFASSEIRVKDLASLGDEICALNYREADTIKQIVGDIKNKWLSLDEQASAKNKWLHDELAKQDYMEKLRIEFAEKATALNRWYKDNIEALGEAVFGDSLEEVIAYKEKLDKQEESLHTTSSAKKSELERLSKEMAALGIRDNKYTFLTLDDMNEKDGKLSDAISKYKVLFSLFIDN